MCSYKDRTMPAVFCALFLSMYFQNCNGFVGLLQRPIPPQRQASSWQRTTSNSMASETTTTIVASVETEEADDIDRQQEQQEHELVWKHLLERFQGDFDNYNQVIQDREQNLLPREGGGHENFHCTLIPVSDTGRLAAFYFDGNPNRIFRFRYYELVHSTNLKAATDDVPQEERSTSPTTTFTDAVEMRLYTLNSKLEALLRSHPEDPMKWPSLFSAFETDDDEDKIKYLPNCEITWSLEIDPIQHAYTKNAASASNINDDDEEEDGIHAVMVHGEAIVDSTLIPGVKIRILDQLSLYENVFYINDRGLDPETGAFIYGNQRGVPYQLERVSSLEDGKRVVVNEELRWTMGEQWRSEEEYQAKLKAAGGPSVGMKPPSSKSSS